MLSLSVTLDDVILLDFEKSMGIERPNIEQVLSIWRYLLFTKEQL